VYFKNLQTFGCWKIQKDGKRFGGRGTSMAFWPKAIKINCAFLKGGEWSKSWEMWRILGKLKFGEVLYRISESWALGKLFAFGIKIHFKKSVFTIKSNQKNQILQTLAVKMAKFFSLKMAFFPLKMSSFFAKKFSEFSR
jgi:hypothetical protein